MDGWMRDDGGWREKVQGIFIMYNLTSFSTTSWPSGLRRYVKAVVFTGVGSNPIDVTFLFEYACGRNAFN